MKIKKFKAASMNEAFKKIKAELGSDAVVLNVREVKRTNKLGLAVEKYLEVTVAVDEGLSRAATAPSSLKKTDSSTLTYGRPKMGQPRAEKGSEATELSELRKELADLRTRFERMSFERFTEREPAQIPSDFLPRFQSLLEVGVPEALACQIVQSAEKEPQGYARGAEEKLLRKIADFFPVPETPLSQKTGPKIVALVGPTGVGKTTTIAKLAATERVHRGKEVGLVSMDTYRIAAVEQLRVFADLTQIPMEVVYKPEHMALARRKFFQKDVVFIDTPGRSPRDGKSLQEIARYLKSIEPDEVHLVLSLSTRSGDLLATVKQFQMIPFNRILFTKLDETDQYGAMLDLAKTVPVPVSYVTYGQDVPDTFREATRPLLSRLILGMETFS